MTTNDDEFKKKLEMNQVKQEEEKTKHKTCLITTLVFLVVFSFLFLIGIAVGVLTSFSETAQNNYNWVRVLYGSIIFLPIVALIIFFIHSLVKILSSPGEE